MPSTDWNTQLEYLTESRKAWFNLDYMEFLIKSVWRIEKPVKVADFGCGSGFLGTVLLPLLPKGSSYTGYDRAEKLLEAAESLFSGSGYETEFICCDLENEVITKQYDIVVCQAFLMHLAEPDKMLRKMKNALVDGGLVICIETNWNVTNAAMYIDGLDVDGYCNLGLLSKLWKKEKEQSGRDKCIGMKVPVMLQKLGLKNVSIRMNDCVRFINPYGDSGDHIRNLKTFLADGWGREMPDEDAYIKSLCERGVTEEEARLQYGCEKEINEHVRNMGEGLTALTIPPMFISYGYK